MAAERDDGTTVALACQGGGAHSAFCAGALQHLLVELPDDYKILGLSGTSGGALCAATAWYGLADDGPDRAAELLDELWTAVAARTVVERAANNATTWTVALGEGGVPVPEVSPYDTPASELAQRDLRSAADGVIEFDRVPALADGDSPRLLVSAVDVTSGEFRVFDGADVTADALLASTAVPTLFEAVEVDGRPHWDGLFAQNPPIKNFLSGVEEAADKPDEIWVLQVNPQRRDRAPTSLGAIADRRSELSGNLSLNQEAAFVERINEWVEDGVVDGERYKHVTVERIGLDWDLPYPSRLDRSPSFIDELIERGQNAAAAFLESTVDEGAD